MNRDLAGLLTGSFLLTILHSEGTCKDQAKFLYRANQYCPELIRTETL
jgi:hypothetical protein